MGFNNTSGNNGVQQAAMQAARIKADAQDGNAVSGLGEQLMEWANDEMKAGRNARILNRKRGYQVEDRNIADAREDKRWERQDKAAAAKAADTVGYRNEQIRLSQERNDISRGKNASPKTTSLWNTPDGSPLTNAEVDQLYKEYKSSQPKDVEKALESLDAQEAASLKKIGATSRPWSDFGDDNEDYTANSKEAQAIKERYKRLRAKVETPLDFSGFLNNQHGVKKSYRGGSKGKTSYMNGANKVSSPVVQSAPGQVNDGSGGRNGNLTGKYRNSPKANESLWRNRMNGLNSGAK